MSHLLVHSMETVWSSSAPSALALSTDTQLVLEGAASTRLAAQAEALNAVAEYAPESTLDLSLYEELRFWIRSSRRATGSAVEPFYLEFSFVDENDAAGEEHRWFVPVSRAGQWEQRRIGIEQERRSSIRSFRFKCLTATNFTCYLDELLAVHEEMLPDVEQALLDRLNNEVALNGLTGLPLKETANANSNSVVLSYNPDFHAGNLLLLKGGTAVDETHLVRSVTQDQVADTTRLDFDAADTLKGTLEAGTSTVNVLVPVLTEEATAPQPPTSPSIILTMLDAREDPERTSHVTQRDSFRSRNGSTVCSMRPAARAYLLDYELKVRAEKRAHQLQIQTFLLQSLAIGSSLRINGSPSPVWILPTTQDEREPGTLPPVSVRVCTRLETSARREMPWIQETHLGAAPLDRPRAPLGSSSSGTENETGPAAAATTGAASGPASQTITLDTPPVEFEPAPAEPPPDQEGIVIVI